MRLQGRVLMMALLAVQAMVIANDNGGTRLSLSTKALEPQPGDMLRNPGLVYEKAEEMAALFRERTQVRIVSNHAHLEPVLGPSTGSNLGLAPGLLACEEAAGQVALH